MTSTPPTSPAASSGKGLSSLLDWELPKAVTIPQNAQRPASIWNTVGNQCMTTELQDCRQHCLNPWSLRNFLAWLLLLGFIGEVLTEVIHPWPSWAWAKSTGTSRLRHRYSRLPSRWEQFWDGAQGFFIPLPPAPHAGWCLGGAGGTSVTRMIFQTGKVSTCPHL